MPFLRTCVKVTIQVGRNSRYRSADIPARWELANAADADKNARAPVSSSHFATVSEALSRGTGSPMAGLAGKLF